MNKLCTHLKIISNRTFNFCLFSSKSAEKFVDHERYKRIHNIYNCWPEETCLGENKLKNHLMNYLTRISETNVQTSEEVEKQLQSLTNLLDNKYRNHYPLPSGLRSDSHSLSANDPPLIGASGANLQECRQILSNHFLKKYTWFDRFLRKLLRFR